jgi:hypothetical protein
MSGENESFIAELEAASNITTSTSTTPAEFSLLKVLILSDNGIQTFWHVWLSILLWMTVSYIFVHIIGFICAVLMLRHHPWMLFISFPFLAMLIIGPSTFGAVTSASIAGTLALANKSITAWHCLILGFGQTLIIIILSFARILATL